MLSLALAVRRFDVAEQHLKEALQQKPIPPQNLRAAALLCGARGDAAGTIRFARASLQHSPKDWDIRLLLARHLLATAAPQTRSEGRAALWDVAQADHSTAAEALLARPQLPIEPVLMELYRARVARELKKDRQADTHWAQAHWLAGDNARALWYLAEYAERMGQTAEAIKAYRRLTRDGAVARPACGFQTRDTAD